MPGQSQPERSDYEKEQGSTHGMLVSQPVPVIMLWSALGMSLHRALAHKSGAQPRTAQHSETLFQW